MKIIEIKAWRIVPMHGGDAISIIGVRADNGSQWQTTDLKVGRCAAPGIFQFQTASGTLYQLKAGDMDPGIWPVQLQMKRGGRFANLQRIGLL